MDNKLSAAYPTNQCVFNVSKNTVLKEIININIPKAQIAMCSINLSGGRTNALNLGVNLFKLPSLDELNTEFQLELQAT